MMRMRLPSELFSLLVVTTVAVLIWFWAAAGTQREQDLPQRRVRFVAADPAALTVNASAEAVKLKVEGSARALQRAGAASDSPLELTLGAGDIPEEPGTYQIDVVSVLSRNPEYRETGVNIVSSDPPTIQLEIDEMVSIDATVRVNLPGVQTEGELQVEPANVKVRIPSRLHQRVGDSLTVDAVADAEAIRQLPAGVPQTREMRLRAPDAIAGNPAVTINPPVAKVTFTIRSRIRTVKIDSVRIQPLGPHEDYREYVVEIPNPWLRNVTVTADTELIRKIEQEQATVIAIIHLSSRDKENGIRIKEVGGFCAVLPDGELIPVQATVEGAPGPGPPQVNLEITPVK